MFEGWGIEEVLFCSWIVCAVGTAWLLTYKEKDMDTIAAVFLFCSLLWPIVWLYDIYREINKQSR